MTKFSPLLAALLATGLPGTGAAQSCDCMAALDSAVTIVSDNYSGWRDKVTPTTRDSLDRHTRRLRTRAASGVTEEQCIELIREWLAWFEDGHVLVTLASPPTPGVRDTTAAGIRAHFAAWERVELDLETARRYLDAPNRTLDPIEGIWETYAGLHYRFAVVPAPDGDGFVAVVLEADSVWWVPGQVKVRFTKTADGYSAVYYSHQHLKAHYGVTVDRNVLLFSPLTPGLTWKRVYPRRSAEHAPEAYLRSRNLIVGFERLSPNTAVVHLPSMALERRSEVDSMVRAHWAELTSTPNLIIDVRGNGGGSDYTFYPLLPLLYTDSIRNPGSSIFSTAENIREFEVALTNPNIPDSSKGWIRNLVAELRARPGEFVSTGGSVVGFDSVLPFPRRVAVLMDGRCASSCEQFVLAARQSRKAALYGERTAGVLDYANVHPVATACPAIRVNYATSRSNRLPLDPVDPHGIPPHVVLPPHQPHALDVVRLELEAESGNPPPHQP